MSKNKYSTIDYEREYQLFKLGSYSANMLIPCNYNSNNYFSQFENGNMSNKQNRSVIPKKLTPKSKSKPKSNLNSKPDFSKKSNQTMRTLKPSRGLSVQSQKTTMASCFSNNNSNSIFNLTQKSSFRILDSKNNLKCSTPSLMTSLRRAKHSTAKIYLPSKKHKIMYWEPHCLRNISTTSIVPNHYSFEKQPYPIKASVSFSSKNLFNKVKTNTCFDHLALNDELIRSDRKKKCLYKKRRYLQDFGLGMIKIIYQINQLIIVIEPFSSFTANIYMIVITEEDNLSSFEIEVPSFERLIASLRFDEDNFIISKSIRQFKYTTQVIKKKFYYSSAIEKDLYTS